MVGVMGCEDLASTKSEGSSGGLVYCEILFVISTKYFF